MANPRIGLALGSGAARGWAHIGLIEALGVDLAKFAQAEVVGLTVSQPLHSALPAGLIPKELAESFTTRQPN